jgi:hypothetical protein
MNTFILKKKQRKEIIEQLDVLKNYLIHTNSHQVVLSSILMVPRFTINSLNSLENNTVFVVIKKSYPQTYLTLNSGKHQAITLLIKKTFLCGKSRDRASA